MKRSLWNPIETILSSPFLSLSLFLISIFAILHFYLILPYFSPKTESSPESITAPLADNSHYIVGDIVKTPSGLYDFKNLNESEWPNLDTWIDTDALLRIANNPITWIRIKGTNIDHLPEAYCLLDHNGGNFQAFNHQGKLIYQYGNPDNMDQIPNLLDTDYSWVNLGKENTEYYYIRFVHKKGHLFGLNVVQNRIGSQSELLRTFAKANLLSLYLNSFFLIFGLICALVYLTQYRKKYYTLLDFSIFTFLIGCLGFSTNDYIRYLSNDRYSIYILSTIFANIVFIPMHSGLKRLFGPGKYNILNWLIIANVIIGTFDMILGINLNEHADILLPVFLKLRILFISFSVANIIGPIVVAYFAWKRGNEIGFGHLVGFSITLTFMLVEIYFSFQDRTSFGNVAYWGVLFGVFAQGLALEKLFFSNNQKMKEFEASLLTAEKSLREVQLTTLQTKLSPHYLFNSLNTIHALHLTKSEQVGDAILRLANNYRFLSDKTDLALIPFEEEWEFVVDFLHLQKLRFFDTVKIHLSKEGDFLNVKIPPLTIQPIVENSFKHGFRNASSDHWMIDISAKIENNNLVLKISDNGSGIKDEQLESDSFIWTRSLGNIKARLAHHFEYCKVSISKNNPSGIVTNILIEKVN
ncbi:MAG: histidine kinase [Leptospira sp.]|nr:histidine kinase [Leptospira sp.]